MNEETGMATEDQPDDPYENMRAAKPWLDDIEAYVKAFAKYNESSDRIDKLYADLEKSAKAGGEREFQIFWANLEVLKPAIYSRPPVPVVASRFKDRKEINRHASEILERTLVTSFDTEDIDATMRLVRDDLATNARGVVWPRYQQSETGEKVCFDHIDRKDFAHEVARKWKEVGWVARRSWLTREQGLKRFEDNWLKATLTDKKDKDNDQDDRMTVKKAPVWEIWSKSHGVVVWVSPGMEDVLDIQEPFLSLEGFFPCPRPAYGTLERSTLKPVPDFVYYKDQVEEINEMTARISALAEALRMKGFYSAGVEELSDAVEAALKKTDNNAILIPVPNTAVLGGAALKDAIVWLPVREVAEVIVQLIGLRKQLIDDVYQITGLSDIMRGATDPNETLGAQELKSQYGSIRVRDRQEELVRLARDITRITGEIIAENFQPQTIMAMSQYEEVPQAQQVQQQIQAIKAKIQEAAQNPEIVQKVQQDPKAMAQAKQMMQQAEAKVKELEKTVTLEQVFEFIKNERMRPFVLEIETDSTIQPDEERAKKSATEFVGALGGVIQQLGALVAAQPKAAPFAAEVLKFAIGPFRAGRPLEAAIDDFADGMKQEAGQPKPDPEAEKAKAEAQAKGQELQLKAKEIEGAGEIKKADLALKAKEIEGRGEIEQAKLALEREKLGQQMEIEAMKAGNQQAEPAKDDSEDQQTKALIDELKQSREQQAQFMEMMAKALTAPKRVVKDENGSPIGVETVQQGKL